MGTQEDKLERAGEKNAVDSSDPVCSFGGKILGTTRTDTRTPMLMYWAGLSRIASGGDVFTGGTRADRFHRERTLRAYVPRLPPPTGSKFRWEEGAWGRGYA